MPDFHSSDGFRLRYTDWGDPTSAIPIILHHGFGIDSAVNWEMPGIVNALIASGRRVLAIDARGHGGSEKPHDPRHYGEPRMADDVVELIDRLSIPAVHLVGYSMGAVVMLLVASRDRRVRKLVAAGVGAGVVEVGGVDTRAISNVAIHRALLAEDASKLTGPEADFRQSADMFGADRAALAAQVQVAYQGGVDLAAITAATLVLVGDADPLAVRPEILAAAIEGATVEVVAGDHRAAIMNPAFAGRICDFLIDRDTQ